MWDDDADGERTSALHYIAWVLAWKAYKADETLKKLSHMAEWRTGCICNILRAGRALGVEDIIREHYMILTGKALS